MYDRPPVADLRDTLTALVAEHPTVADATHQQRLRQQVCAMVDELKSGGWPPERVIVAVKQVADDAGLHPSRGVLSTLSPLTDRDAMLVNMVRWCIEQYYGVETPAA